MPVCGAQTLVCGRTAVAPEIDGQPSEACWQQAMVATDFAVLGSGGAERAFRQTTVRAAWDASALYLHAICLEPDPGSITAAVTGRDGDVWMEDAIEVFLQPDPAKADVVHLILNAKGVLYDELNGNPDFNAAVTVAATVGAQAWQVELAIPWLQLRRPAPTPPANWGFNVAREHRPHEPCEWSTWAALEKGRHEFGAMAGFGRLEFADQARPGRVSALVIPPGALTANPALVASDGRHPDGWSLAGGSTATEIVPLSRHYTVRNDRDYGVVSQPLDIPVTAGDVYTVFAVLRGSNDCGAGIAVVQEMADGQGDDLYPFWNMAVTGDFRLYSGRITVDKGARRFQSLNVYRANRSGTLEVAYVQVLPGLHGATDVVDAARCTRPDERGRGAPWATPCLRGFRPLPGGALKTLLFIGEFQRDAAELTQRFDADLDVVYCPTFRGSGKVDETVAFEAERILKTLARHEYRLIILAGPPSKPAVVDGILDSVKAGAGLLVVEPLAGGGPGQPAVWQRLAAAFPQTELAAERWAEVMGALDRDVLRQTSGGQAILRSVAAGELGAGRILRLTWGEAVPGLVPFSPGVCEYWEYRWTALCHAALWAARRAPVARFTAVTCGEQQLTLRADCTVEGPLEALVDWDTPFGIRRSDVVSLTADAGHPAALPVPPGLRASRAPAIARVVLRRQGQPLDVAACVVPDLKPMVELLNVEAPGEARSGVPFTVAVTYRLATGAAAALDVDLVDAWRRVVARAPTALLPGEHRTEVVLAVPEALCVYHRVVATAYDRAKAPIDRRETEVLVPDASRDALSDFSLGAGYAAMRPRCPEYLRPHMVAFLRANGVTACAVDEPLIRQGMSAWGGTVAGVGMTYKGSESVRRPCFNDPAQMQTLVDGTLAGIAKRRAWGFVGYNMSDEVHLSQDSKGEVCTCEHCRAQFCQWAQSVYGTIAAANREWGTTYGGFADVTIPRLGELKGTANPSRWIDFRLFMDWSWATWYSTVHDAVHAAYPDARLSFTNPFRFDSLSGTDFALWAPHEDVVLRYCHRNVLDRNRAWSRAPVLSWFGYRSTATEAGRFVWWFALNGGVLPIWWDALEPWAYSNPSWGECSSEGFTPWYLFGPLWRETGRSRVVSDAAQDLQTGIGRLLRAAVPAPPQAAILHSQASLHALYADAALVTGRATAAGYNRYAAADDAFAAALKRRGVAYTYVLPEQLGTALPESVRLIVMPACVALTDASAAALQAFVERGGVLLADVLPATRDGHGKPRDASPLAAVFAGDRGICLGQYATAESAAAIDERLAALPSAPLAGAWHTAGGGLPGHTEVYRFRLGAGEYYGLVRDVGDAARGDGAVRIPLAGACHVYDCRRRTGLGRLSEIEVDPAPGTACFFAALPYAPSGLEASAEVRDRRLVIGAALAGVAKATDHVFRVEVTPAGADRPAAWYCRNVLAPAGTTTVSLPLALDDPPGPWRIVVRDVATGVSATVTATVP